ncbi:Fes1-domain-containing protein [Glonium stellatum]|uniref:Fes1-domain-containing protein n=1 Tax=Glonium stellatum TaxID=574774 RepID=A0A8E2F974_9PEZI|nr:Fes1-domain-containing protein [Glonium stellatum]
MNDPGFTNLLKWGVENSDVSRKDSNAQPNQNQSLNSEALAALFGNRPSDAELMEEFMDSVEDETLELKKRLIAFDNFEQLIEGIDNANNMEPLRLWGRLVEQLGKKEAEFRTYAAWCCAIAVQNNVKAQERLLLSGAIPTLVRLAIEDTHYSVRKKAILALSSAIRNYQPALDEAIASMPKEHTVDQKLDAADMDSVNILIQRLRDHSERLG